MILYYTGEGGGLERGQIVLHNNWMAPKKLGGGGIGTIVPGLFVKLRQGIYYEIGDEQQSKVRNIVIDW